MVRAPKLNVRKSAHVIVVGNEEDGFGKATAALHIAVGLMRNGQRVAAMDLDHGKDSLADCLERRRVLATRTGSDLPSPTHYRLGAGGEVAELAAFKSAMAGGRADP